MSERNYYVICDDNCKFESMTKEQIIAAIASATGKTPTSIDDAFITKIKEQNRNIPLKFWIGTQAEYNAIENPEDNTFYIFTDGDELVSIKQLAQETAEKTATEYIDNFNLVERKKDLIINEIPYGENLDIEINSEAINYQLVDVRVQGFTVTCRAWDKTFGTNHIFYIMGVGFNNVTDPDSDLPQASIHLLGRIDAEGKIKIYKNASKYGSSSTSVDKIFGVI